MLSLPVLRMVISFLCFLTSVSLPSGRGEKADGSGTFSDTTYLGATLMEIMLKETQEFCNPNMSSHFESHAHHQVR